MDNEIKTTKLECTNCKSVAIEERLQKKIEENFKNGNPILQKVPCKGEIPTVQELLDYVFSLPIG